MYVHKNVILYFNAQTAKRTGKKRKKFRNPYTDTALFEIGKKEKKKKELPSQSKTRAHGNLNIPLPKRRFVG